MPTFIVKNNPGLKLPIQIDGEDAHHLVKVMRIHAGETVSLTDNEGCLAKATILSTHPLQLDIINKSQVPPTRPITVFLPLIDQERLEWAIEKLCEINIKTVQLITTQRTQSRVLSTNKINRLFKIAVSAQKQCHRAWPLNIKNPIQLSAVQFDTHEQFVMGSLARHDATPFLTKDKGLNLIVGPEGGFTAVEELFLEQNQVQKISLGSTVLRTETAAILLAGIFAVSDLKIS